LLSLERNQNFSCEADLSLTREDLSFLILNPEDRTRRFRVILEIREHICATSLMLHMFLKLHTGDFFIRVTVYLIHCSFPLWKTEGGEGLQDAGKTDIFHLPNTI
jgi:hypothetical protein